MGVIKNAMWIVGRTRVTTNPGTLSSREYHTSRALSSTATKHAAHNSTVDQQDVEQHSKMVKDWWSPFGPMKALHTYNLIRVPFIRNGLTDPSHSQTMFPLKGKKILDVGCGGGILSEPLARLGAEVTGIDASKVLIDMAQEHSENNEKLRNNKPKYFCTTIEEHAKNCEQEYDGVVCSEIIEHVTNKELFIQSCVETLKLRGRIFFTTPNRTRLARIGVIFLAENVLRVVPKGTHQIEKFVTPNEIQFMLERNKCFVELTHGIMYNPITNRWSWSNTQSFVFALQAIRTQY
ncbi:hypothetical protein O0L34_g5358 [Tuta absoluta]|nr:hypothetical protein O0L34_g5358 [Tuta absoluta]